VAYFHKNNSASPKIIMPKYHFTAKYFPFLILFFTLNSAAQTTIRLRNASFEDLPSAQKVPTGWSDCGFQGQTPPDIQPNPAFQVITKAQQGNTYMGLVTREDETWEGVSQKLSQPLEADHCYDMSIFLARSNTYISVSQMSGTLMNFNKAVLLRIYGGNSECDRREKLYESPAVEHTNWKAYNIKLKPKGTYSYIFIEAYFANRAVVAYGGNLLVDDISPIVEDISCIKKLPPDAVADNSKPKPEKPPKPPKPIKLPVDTPPTPKPKLPVSEDPSNTIVQVDKPQSMSALSYKNLYVGARFNMDNVLFDADKFDVKDISLPQLDKLADLLMLYTSVVVEIGGHTNDRLEFEDAYSLSTQRADAVADYLKGKGIAANQIKTRGYGKNSPIATNTSEAGRKQNQRVEVKIIKK
jgi:outer membrane protein OmpA-like peptidoglycan-associated protein